jgi:hypothetical protein
MTPNPSSSRSAFPLGPYRDLRDGARYHVDAECPVGQRIPQQFIHPGKPANARLCSVCADRKAKSAAA